MGSDKLVQNTQIHDIKIIFEALKISRIFDDIGANISRDICSIFLGIR